MILAKDIQLHARYLCVCLDSCELVSRGDGVLVGGVTRVPVVCLNSLLIDLTPTRREEFPVQTLKKSN